MPPQGLPPLPFFLGGGGCYRLQYNNLITISKLDQDFKKVCIIGHKFKTVALHSLSITSLR